MKLQSLSYSLSLLSVANAFDCTPAAFSAILPSNASVTFAQSVAQGSTFQVPAGDIAYPISPTGLRATCALQVKVVSSSTSAFSFGLFLPIDWNGRFLAVGNGGFAGGVNWLDMGAGLGYGFAVMSTDTGHNSTSRDGTWALNKESLADWGYRAMHGSILQSKEITAAYYGKAPRYSYYSGCSTGGRQGLKEVQLHPETFDGVVAGAPAWWTNHLQPWTVKVASYNLPVNSSHHIPASLFPAIAAEVLKQCDGSDGLVDSVIQDPRRCDFYPEALLCGPGVTNQTASGCLTSPQIDTLYHIYNDYVDVNQTFVFPALALGSEAQWPVLLGGNAPATLGTQYVQYFLLNDPSWQWQDFDYSIIEQADAQDPGNATAGDFAALGEFQKKGGKVLMYHGYSDALIPTHSSVYFYKHVLRTLAPEGVDLDSFYRFFLVPGMQHCSGTPANVNAPWYFAGPGQSGDLSTSLHSVPGFGDARHDVLLSLMSWVENGTAPNQIIATKWRNDTLQDRVLRQRPLCMFPKQAVYRGHGDVNQAANWVCESLYGAGGY